MSIMKKISVFIVLFLVGIFSLAAINGVFSPARESISYLNATPTFNEALEKNHVVHYRSIIDEIQNPRPASYALSRNSFFEKKEIKEVPPFVVESITLEKIPMVFKGSIVRGNSVTIAQINLGEKTHFVKPNTTLENWQIQDITKDHVIITNTSGEQHTLELNKVTFSNERIIRLRSTTSNAIYTVKKGDIVEDYKVLDIKEDAVILSKNNLLITILNSNQ